MPRWFALTLSLALGLPSPALALRPTNAGMEESPVQRQLNVGLRGPAAGLEEEGVPPDVPRKINAAADFFDGLAVALVRAPTTSFPILLRETLRRFSDFEDVIEPSAEIDQQIAQVLTGRADTIAGPLSAEEQLALGWLAPTFYTFGEVIAGGRSWDQAKLLRRIKASGAGFGRPDMDDRKLQALVGRAAHLISLVGLEELRTGDRVKVRGLSERGEGTEEEWLDRVADGRKIFFRAGSTEFELLLAALLNGRLAWGNLIDGEARDMLAKQLAQPPGTMTRDEHDAVIQRILEATGVSTLEQLVQIVNKHMLVVLKDGLDAVIAQILNDYDRSDEGLGLELARARQRIMAVQDRLRETPLAHAGLEEATATVRNFVETLRAPARVGATIVAVGPSVLAREPGLRTLLEAAAAAGLEELVAVPEDPTARRDLVLRLSVRNDGQAVRIVGYRDGADVGLEEFAQAAAVLHLPVTLTMLDGANLVAILQRIAASLGGPAVAAGLEELRRVAAALDTLA